ncbi:MAG: PEGA domain-containing protein [Chthoniobacterales bacterium]
MKSERTRTARKKWTFLFGILAIVAVCFFGFELWQWIFTFWQAQSATGSFSVSSVPSGAIVRWKGRELGHTPLQRYVLPSGDQVIEITAPGYQSCPIELTIRTGAFVDLGVRSLAKLLGKLRLVTDPPRVSYLVVGPDKKTIAGLTPDTIENLPLGRYGVKLIQPGWPEYAQSVDINSGEPIEVSRKFKGGSVELTSDPAGATILVGGSKLGTAPLTANLPTEPVEVTSRFGTLVPVVQTLVPDAERVVSFHFKHSYGTLLASSDRTDAVLIVDGVDYGHPPAQLFLAPGNHKLLLSAPNAPDKTRRVDLMEGQRASVQINFGPTIGEVAPVSNSGGSPTPTPANSASVTPATPVNTPNPPTGTPHPVQLASRSTPAPTPSPASTPAPESNQSSGNPSLPSPTPETSASGSEEKPMIPPANAEQSPLPTPVHEQPKPVRTLSRSVVATKRASAAVTPSSSASPQAEKAKSKKEAFQLLDSQLKANDEALNLERQSIESQIRNSSGAIREQWKYRLAEWRLKKARADRDRAAEEAKLKEQWK